MGGVGGGGDLGELSSNQNIAVLQQLGT